MKLTQVNKVMQRASERCSENGVRFTEKRQSILRLLLKSPAPLSAYEIVDLYREETGETIQGMSVYRMLDFLVENALAHKLVSANKFVACSHIACHHEHETPQFLICEGCGAVKEIAVKGEVVKTLRKGAADAGWQLLSPALELPCLCDRCAA
ncbi:transcriptional repressor [Microbulbifer agarilyticus]|uniref:Fur family transcriptional regulator n=1 Tax=Microbulbifer agarilyticus TaxID=260552 RepID=UPI001C93AD5D|nr:transcriptional repressor [Microbulbifer agarilyticus]MBY6190269.1 transcriptional repressor [Microbulbifer agarilyticus]MBY6210275.1 transcriptional repressor [Microbulbifer agarilyticus]